MSDNKEDEALAQIKNAQSPLNDTGAGDVFDFYDEQLVAEIDEVVRIVSLKQAVCSFGSRARAAITWADVIVDLAQYRLSAEQKEPMLKPEWVSFFGF